MGDLPCPIYMREYAVESSVVKRAKVVPFKRFRLVESANRACHPSCGKYGASNSEWEEQKGQNMKIFAPSTCRRRGSLGLLGGSPACWLWVMVGLVFGCGDKVDNRMRLKGPSVTV